ncbi:hypothetical protein DC366_13055 [Pelagivirga sediminicola]|uniref:DUF2125 domain-containing protein n=1 Tax=Pelagivirga sediminicola TaxID=2170575 RepID=A0A2T7G5B0_9RHOB|nr:DUF2125 domain-containing protein [Pelagivirga sediminicola]PVA09613.1 hypothetical protein DC366_13055 [Pelagivirga sediminicola]
MTAYRSAAAMTAGAILTMTVGTAMADVTPQQVWTDWKAYMTDFGYEVAAKETQSAEGLTLNDIVMTFNDPNLDAVTEVAFPQMSLLDNGDGTVSIEFPQELPVSMTTDGPQPVSFDMIYKSTGMDLKVAGDPEKMTYTSVAEAITLTMDEMTVGEDTVKFDKLSLTMNDVDSTTVSEAGDSRVVNQVVTTGPMTYEVAFDAPDEPGNRVEFSGMTEMLKMNAASSVPAQVGTADMAAAIKAGFALDGNIVAGPGSSTFAFTEEDSVTSGTTKSGGGNLAFMMGQSGIEYGGGTSDLAVEVVTPNLPFPVTMEMQEAKFDLVMPLMKGEEPQDAALSFNLSELTLSEAIWAMFDPQGKLPRDPATVAVELAAKVRLLGDLLDPAMMASYEEGDEVPAEVEALTLQNLVVRMIGAELTGAGDLTFDNDDTETYDGMPKPVGDVQLKLTGANAVLDTLVEMGMIPEDQVMGMRMMMGVFAVPVEGEDTLNSKIEFTEEGQILANGQRLK